VSFFQDLERRCREADTLVCIGLDPHEQDLSEPSAAAARAYCLALIEATAPCAAAFKPNAAFFEAFGPEGMQALADVIAAVPAGIPVILDVKRGDISSTARGYATAAYDRLRADAVTLNPYMGWESVSPFVAERPGAAFLLCRTSNPSAAELQDLEVHTADGRSLRVFERVADLAVSWATRGEVGLVVGATRPDELAAVRARAPKLWILAPGVGAQGGSLEEAVSAGRREDGLGLLITASRSIARADDPAAAARELRDAVRAAVRLPRRTAVETARRHLADGLLRTGCVRFGDFTLKSGLKSPIYLDLRRLIGDPALLAEVAGAYAALHARLAYDVLAPLPYAAMPIGTAISLRTGEPMVYPRREVKEYGTKAAVEGVFTPGQVAIVVDDLATTGGSKLEGIEKLRAVGLEVNDVTVLIDRESGAVEAMAAVGVRLHAVFTLTELLAIWSASGAVSAEQVAAVRRFLIDSRAGQA
jgi:uridine monophosphate synthetase